MTLYLYLFLTEVLHIIILLRLCDNKLGRYICLTFISIPISYHSIITIKYYLSYNEPRYIIVKYILY